MSCSAHRVRFLESEGVTRSRSFSGESDFSALVRHIFIHLHRADVINWYVQKLQYLHHTSGPLTARTCFRVVRIDAQNRLLLVIIQHRHPTDSFKRPNGPSTFQ